eukprot:gene3688-4205_t
MVHQFEDALSKSSFTAEDAADGGKDENRPRASEKKKKFDFDPVLMRYRVFFFLFFGGFGTTFPYLGIYFKQIGLSAASVGILAGVRPLIQFVSGPFWSLLADKYKARKLILLFSIFSWLVMTVVLAFPRPHDYVCRRVNESNGSTGNGRIVDGRNAQKKDRIPTIAYNGHIGELLLPVCFPQCKMENDVYGGHLKKRQLERRKNVLSYLNDKTNQLSINNQSYTKHDLEIETVLGNNPGHNQHRNNHRYFAGKKSNTTGSRDSQKFHYVIENNPQEMKNIFIVLLMLIIAGEFLEAPTFILTDTALLEYLGESRTNYGKTRLFGSVGYGVASFGIGAILDRTHFVYCGKKMVNYTFLFYVFAVFMVIGFFFALFAVKFSYKKTTTEKSTCFKEVWQLFCTLKIFSFLVMTWYLGFTHGGIMNFLNWYLEDLGATRFMMGIGTLCRSFAVVCGFMSSNYFITRFGHLNMILFALVLYTLSFFGYSIIPNAWYALPIEFGQGVCYSISWSASITYLGAAAPKNAEATVQGVLQGVYWGLGTGIGAFVGGAMINTFGAVKSFRIGGVVSAIVVFVMLVVNHVVNRQDQEGIKDKVSTKLKDFTNVVSSAK